MQSEPLTASTASSASHWGYAFGVSTYDNDGVSAWLTALVAVVLFHMIIAVLWYHALVSRQAVAAVIPVVEALELELEPDLFNGKMVAVPVNPAANQDVPEATSNVADQNQVAAAEQAHAEEGSDMPVLDGDQAVLFALEEGQRKLSEQMPSIPMGMPFVSSIELPGDAEQLNISITDSRGDDPRAQLPLAIAGDYGDRVLVREDAAILELDEQGRVVSLGLEEAPAGVTVLPAVEDPVDSERAYVIHDAPQVDSESAPPNQFEIVMEQPDIHLNVPQGIPLPLPRPAVKSRKDAGPLIKNELKPAKIGKDAVDANFNLMGVYGKRMREVYLSQWDILAESYTFSSKDTGSKVDVYFVLTKEGEIKAFEVVNTTATQGATLLIQDAIQSRAPYEPWTQDMIRVFGDEFGFRLSFYYFRVH